MTNYPSSKDTTSTFYIIDGVTPIDSNLFKRFSTAILAIENELGINPSGVYSDIRQRLDAIDGYGSSGGFLPLGTIYQHVEYDGTSWVSVDNITLPKTTITADSRIITTQYGNISILPGPPINISKSLLSSPSFELFSGGDVVYKHGVKILGGNGLTGATDNTLDGGDINITAGDGGTNGFGGFIKLFGGISSKNSTIDGQDSYVYISGGQSNGIGGVSGSVFLSGGIGAGTNTKGGNIHLIPGHSTNISDVGKILIEPPTTGSILSPTLSNKYSIYAKTNDVDGYYPGLRYNGSLNQWEYKNDGNNESSWSTLTLPVSSVPYQHIEYNGTSWVVVNDITLPQTVFETDYRQISAYKGDLRIIPGVPIDPSLSLYFPPELKLYSGGNVNLQGISLYGGDANNEMIEPVLDGGFLSLQAGWGGTKIASNNGYGGFVEIIGGGSYRNNVIGTASSYIYIKAGDNYGTNSTAGSITLLPGTAHDAYSKGGDLHLWPGKASSQNSAGKILIEPSVISNVSTNTYSIYANSGNVDGYYAGLRYNGSLSEWEYKIDGDTESSWKALSQASSSSVISILWNSNIIDGYVVYEDSYSSAPIAKLAISNNYSTSKAIGVSYSTINKVLISGVYSVYCESSTISGDDLYLSYVNQGMVTNIYPTTTNNSIVRIGKAFSEKSSGIGKCDILIEISEPILLENNV